MHQYNVWKLHSRHQMDRFNSISSSDPATMFGFYANYDICDTHNRNMFAFAPDRLLVVLRWLFESSEPHTQRPVLYPPAATRRFPHSTNSNTRLRLSDQNSSVPVRAQFAISFVSNKIPFTPSADILQHKPYRRRRCRRRRQLVISTPEFQEHRTFSPEVIGWCDIEDTISIHKVSAILSFRPFML